ncbi:MAG: Fic family protein [Aerococcaceae bacterium]|nr:Fic family protein [Aerococcaceae bacterium]
MTYTQKYLDDILVRMAYHSSGIEGNTISLPETVSIILENTLPQKGKSIREFYEIENHKQTFHYLVDLLSGQETISIHALLNIHSLLTDRLQHDKGHFKTQQNAIIGAEFKTATPHETPHLMQQWVDNTNYRLQHADSEQTILETLADTHIQFERIHPFSDGNGRVGRLVLLYLSMLYLSAPVVISRDNRAEYMELLANQDVNGLAAMLKQSLDYERERIGTM